MESGILKVHYTHLALPADVISPDENFQVYLSADATPNLPDPLAHALFTMRLAVELGIKLPSDADPHQLPYADETDNLVFDAPLTSLVCGRRIRLLRGWKQFGSCVKGFNALGLLAEHAQLELRKLETLAPKDLEAARLAYLASRRRDGAAVFPANELATLSAEQLGSVELLHVALWRAYARRTVVCSTSSNMGISLHEALRYMQRRTVRLGGKGFTILNDDEGELIIWAPDEQADFMNPEKTAKLRELEADKPRLTVLHTYINRKQRDPGALKDALNAGGYFFPTNPQSREELQNLLSISLGDIARERNIPFEELLVDPNVRVALESLGARIVGDRVAVRGGVTGGLLGLAVPYLIMLEETLRRGDATASSTWNQASIGAALAAIVLCDATLREGPGSSPAWERIGASFPTLAAFLERKRLGRDFATRIHGLFDIANLQSLAQLFGVVVTKHLSGRGTAFVGLGSSSYANGNSCFDVLRASAAGGGAFRGRDGLHPATHTLNPIAQALVYAEDFARAAFAPGFDALSEEEKVARLRRHAIKPEPAGAAAVAGYLLTRLDAGTLTYLEIAYALRLAGFDQERFLEFANFGRDEQSRNRFIQEASEEGEYMESLARSLLVALGRDVAELSALSRAERARSRLAYRWTAPDEDAFEAFSPVVNLYMTGDNCAQPSAGLVTAQLRAFQSHRALLREELDADRARSRRQGFDMLTAAKAVYTGSSGLLTTMQRGLDAVMTSRVKPAVNRAILNGDSAPKSERRS